MDEYSATYMYKHKDYFVMSFNASCAVEHIHLGM